MTPQRFLNVLIAYVLGISVGILFTHCQGCTLPTDPPPNEVDEYTAQNCPWHWQCTTERCICTPNVNTPDGGDDAQK